MALIKNKKLTVYENLKKRIINSDLAPGLPINENDIACELNVSKTPVREALSRLERERLIDTVPGRGSTVAQITFRDIREIFEIREIIECGAAKRAALLCDKKEVLKKKQSLMASVEKLDIKKDHGEGQCEAVHFFLIEITRNERLIKNYLSLLDNIARIRNHFGERFTYQRSKEILAEHIEILDALIAEDPERAERAVQNHLRNASAYLSGLILPVK